VDEVDVKEAAERILRLKYPRGVGFTVLDVGCSLKILERLRRMGALRLVYRVGGIRYYDVASPAKLSSIASSSGGGSGGCMDAPRDLFSVIEGYDDVKRLLWLTLKAEKPVHVLMTGPPGCAKTMFMLELNRLHGAVYVLGSRSSKAGLSSLLIEKMPRILLIDEIDKMNYKDTSVLLSLMETGIVSETLFGRVREERLDTRVIAACNVERKLDRALISRFTVVRFSEYSPEEFVRVAARVLAEREGLSLELARYIAESLKNITRDVRAAIQVGRRCRSRSDVDWMINKFYVGRVRL
jgi:Holliday junction DNA helicase RuvB